MATGATLFHTWGITRYRTPMGQAWDADIAIDAAFAQLLVAEQFPELAPVRAVPLGEGWDNAAFVINDAFVFRFPRRNVAVFLLQHEIDVLPALANRLPLPIPVIAFAGQPTERFPFPFMGYRRLIGESACSAAVDLPAAATTLGQFLRALHAVAPPPRLQADTYQRAQLPSRRDKLATRLQSWPEAQAKSLLSRLDSLVDTAPAAHLTTTHGDVYPRHILVDSAGLPSGVIDWGDLHLGDPAIDLAIAFTLLPLSLHQRFRDAYGGIDDTTWARARFHGVHYGIVLTDYGRGIGDSALLRVGGFALETTSAL